MRILWTRAALDGLGEIADHVAHHNPGAALRRVTDIPARTNAVLAENPMIGRVGRVAGTRELMLSGTPYLVAYRVRDHVDVLAVLHGARMAGCFQPLRQLTGAPRGCYGLPAS